MPSLTDRQVSDTGSTAADYFVWQPEGAAFPIRMHRDAIDGIARDVIEEVESQPRRAAEVGGLLLGRITAGSVCIDRYLRIACHHRFGPRWALDDDDRTVLESSAASIHEAGEFSVVGLYRSHTRQDFDIDDAHRDQMRRYFADSNDLVLLIRPVNRLDLEGRFFARPLSVSVFQEVARTGGDDVAVEPMGTAFPFQGRGISLDALGTSLRDPESDPEATRQTPARPVPEAKHASPRQIIPDFIPAHAEPAHAHTDTIDLLNSGAGAGIWWPLLAAACVVALITAFFIIPPGWPSGWPGHRKASTAAAAPASHEPARPLGLSVNPDGSTWRVSWNPGATALQGARSVQLFVREGDDQNRIELAPRDLASGTYQYRPSSDDVTFRLEVTEASGTITAESFRFRQLPASVPAPVASPAPEIQRTAPKAIHRVAPVVAGSIRPRIPGKVPIDIRVKVDRAGHVVSAEPVSRARDGLHKYLADRAVFAAKQWRFEPARADGQPVEGEATIHFVFQK